MSAEASVKPRTARKSATAYRTISEVSDDLAVPQHVLRFWETKFSQVRPLKRGGGRRYYRPEDVALLRRIQKLLYEDGFTIKGVQKLLREGRDGTDGPETDAAAAGEAAPEEGLFAVTRPAPKSTPDPAVRPAQESLPDDLRMELVELLGELRVLRAALKGFGA